MAGKEFTDYLHAAPQTGPEFRRDFVAPPDRKRGPLLDERQHAAAQKMEIKRHANVTFEGLPVNGTRQSVNNINLSEVLNYNSIINIGEVTVPKGYVAIARRLEFSLLSTALSFAKPSALLDVTPYPIFIALGGLGSRLMYRALIDESVIAGHNNVLIGVSDDIPMYIVVNENQRLRFEIYLDRATTLAINQSCSTSFSLVVDYIPIKTENFRDTIIEG